MDQIPKSLVESYIAANTGAKKKEEICKIVKYLTHGECVDIANILASNGYRNNIKFSSDGGHVNLDVLPATTIDLLYSSILNKINARAV